MTTGEGRGSKSEVRKPSGASFSYWVSRCHIYTISVSFQFSSAWWRVVHFHSLLFTSIHLSFIFWAPYREVALPQWQRDRPRLRKSVGPTSKSEILADIAAHAAQCPVLSGFFDDFCFGAGKTGFRFRYARHPSGLDRWIAGWMDG